MIPAALIHNPNAGEGEHSRENLEKLLTEAGYECRYASAKEKGWDDIAPDTELLIVAGGDGTIRKVVKKLLKRKISDKQVPLGVLPAGTANNIAKTLNIPHDPQKALNIIKRGNALPYDIGKAEGGEDTVYFMESYGIGLFPLVMKEMERHDDIAPEERDEKIKMALITCRGLLQNYEAHEVTITADGADYSGKYIMVEIMNAQSIGPNLVLAPKADPGDGVFELVLIPEEDREKFGNYLQERIDGKDVAFKYRTIEAKNISLSTERTYAHTDDELLKLKEHYEISICVLNGAFRIIR